MSKSALTADMAIPRSVPELVELFPPMLIETKKDFSKAQKLVDQLAVRSQLTKAQSRYLATLTLLMDEYESRVDAELEYSGDAIDILSGLVDQHGMSGRELGTLLGQPQLGSKLLRRERELSKKHIRILSEHFGVSADLFLRVA